jgi:HK97 family phage prohead protease
MDFKAAVLGAGDGDLKDGEIIALVSVFNNVDTYGDVVMPGAFKADLQEWADRGDPIPFIWAHDWSDPFAHVGVVKAADETDDGLRVRAFISPEERESNPKANQVYRLLKNRRVTQFSFAFDVIEGGFGDRDGREVFELRQLKIHEVGPCLLGVNQETELIAAKAARLASQPGDTGPEMLTQLKAARDHLTAIVARQEFKAEQLTEPLAETSAGTGNGQKSDLPNTGDPDRAPGEDPREDPPMSARKGLTPASCQLLADIEQALT